MKTFLLPLFGLLSLLLICACNQASVPAEDITEDQPLSFSAPQPDFTTTIVEADLPSPRKEMQGELNKVNVTVNYGSPSTKGRTIFGSLVPYGEVWRTGANEATRFTIDTDILIDEKQLPAGTYSLFTVPNKDSWEVIFNETADQWGAYEYNSEKDVLRVNMQPVQRDSSSKNLEFVLAPGALQLRWDKVVLPITFTKA
jgi:hypothetical protein